MKDEKSYKNIFIYYIGLVMVKDLSYVKVNSVNSLYLIINKINRYIEKSNETKYLTVVLTNESIGILKTCEELCNKIRYLIRSITNDSDNYDEKYMKIKFNTDIKLPLRKTLELCNMVIVV